MRFYPNPTQWRIIWAAVGIMIVAGLFLLPLDDLSYPSAAQQKEKISQKKAEQERACAEARAIQRSRTPAPCRTYGLLIGFFETPVPRRERAQQELTKYFVLVTGVVGGLLVWQLSAKRQG
jgi:hypothetical protein